MELTVRNIVYSSTFFKEINSDGISQNTVSMAFFIDCSVSFSPERYDSSNECPGYDTKQSDGEVPVMLELWGMRSTPSLTSSLVHSGLTW